MRLIAPLLIASTLSLFGSGVALIIAGHGGGLLLIVHAVSFVVVCLSTQCRDSNTSSSRSQWLWPQLVLALPGY
jgi:hypothetical protein